MRTFTIRARCAAAPHEVLDVLSPSGTTTWAVPFRGRQLTWVQRATTTDHGGQVDFTAIDGDLKEFTGQWQVRDAEAGSEVTMQARYALGVPIYDRIIEPLLAPVITAALLAALPGTVAELDTP